MARSMSISQARRLFLQAQGFGDAAPKGSVTRRHVKRAMGRMQLLQLDSVPVIIRSQYLPLYSRLGPYRTDLLNQTIYKHRDWFECWSHEANIMPVEREPLFRWHKAAAAQGESWATWTGLHKLANKEKAYVQQVLDEVTERGALAASDLTNPRKPKKGGDWWSGRSMGLHVMDWLYRIGEFGVIRDDNFNRTFDLLDRIVPQEIIKTPTPEPVDAQRQLLMLAAESMGVATAKDIADYYRFPIRVTRKLVAELVEDGKLVETQVEGWDKPAFRHPHATLPRTISPRAFLSPFDPVVWCRPRALRMFDFTYTIEIYVPKAKRVYGYYVLPFLLGETIVGRVDMKTHRDAAVLEVKAAHIEPGQDPAYVAAEMAAELPRLAELVGADTVKVSCRRAFGRKLAAAIV